MPRLTLLLLSTLLFLFPVLLSAQTMVDFASSELKAAERFQDGVDLWHTGNRRTAIVAWEDAVKLNPNLAEAHYNLGVALRDQKILLKKDNCFDHDDVVQCLSAKNHLSRGPAAPLEKALRSLKEATRLNPEHPRAVYMKAVIEGQLERYDHAQLSLAQHLKNVPEDFKGHYLLCVTHRAKAEYRKAISACKRAIAEKQGYVEAVHTLGTIYLTQKQSHQALGSFKEVIRLRPRSQSGWFNLGLAESGSENFIEAINAYKRALDLGPTKGAINLNIGAAYDELEKGSQAIAFTRTARKLFSENREWRQAARANDNLTRFMNKYWGLPEKKPFYLN